MEAPLNARDFLKRFHLPQLVRLSNGSDTTTDDQAEQVDQNQQARNGRRPVSELLDRSSSYHSNTSISSSFVALSNGSRQQQQQRQHEKSNWTYRSSKQASRSQLDITEQQQQQHQEHGFRSLLNQPIGDETPPSSSGLCSISAWSSAQVNQMLNQTPQVAFSEQQPLMRMPRASLQIQPQQPQVSSRAAIKKSVEFESGIESGRSITTTTTSSSNDEQFERAQQQSIRLAPPSKRLTLCKLQLNQPFLLYKAYKKLELCAYMIDTKNELNEKSGDPIYFPHNYPGKFSARLLMSASSPFSCFSDSSIAIK